ncbi:MAG: tandem-95 repeat protein, partial [Mycolicibacterium cosmeticum]|nr:tandem-95 repeat protein [Mycolicibacterium cosmeticum]
NGTWTYTPAPDFNGTDTFTYTVSDGTLTDTGTVTITVNPINDPPIANDDLAATTENAPVSGNVLTNDTDVDVDALEVTTTAPMTGTYGTLTIDANGHYTYTPGGGQFTLSDPAQVTQGTYDSDFFIDGVKPYAAFTFVPSTTGSYVIEQLNIPRDTTLFVYDGAFDPAAENDNLIAVDDDSGPGVTPRVTVNLIAGQTYTIVNSTWDTGGTLDVPLSFTSSGPAVVAGMPVSSAADALADGETDTDTFTYEVSDGNGGFDTATLTITVTGTNDAPVANDDTGLVDEDGELFGNVLTNDTDIDGDVLSIPAGSTGVFTGSAGGQFTLHGDGNYAYRPADDVVDSETFTYTVTDPGGLTDTATITFTITPVNDAPVGVPDFYTTDEDVALTVPAPGLVGNDSDIDGPAPIKATIWVNSTNGTAVVNADGSFTYTPNANWSGVDTFYYAPNDGIHPSGVGAPILVTITVNPINDPPIANPDGPFNGLVEDQPISAPESILLGNDTDADNDPLTITLISAANGTITNIGGTLTYTPNLNFNGTDTITYTISDPDGATSTTTATVNVAAVDDLPVVDPSDGATVYTENDGDTPVVVDPALTVTDPDSNIVSANISITNAQPGDQLSWTPPPGITNIGIQSNSGTAIVLIGTGTPTEYEAALRNITFSSPGDNPTAGSRTINFTVNTITGANTDTKTVTVVPVADDAVVGTFAAGSSPIDIERRGDFLYVSDETGAVTVLNIDDGSHYATIPVTGSPWGLAVEGDRLYVGDESSPRVTVINTDTNQIVDTDPITEGTQNLAVGGAPYYVVVANGKLYVQNWSNGTVSVFETDTETDTYSLVAVIPTTNGTFGYDVSGNYLYAVNTYNNHVTVIDTNIDTVVDMNDDLPGYQSISGGIDSRDAAVVGNHLYLANQNGTVSVVDLSTQQVDTISIPGGGLLVEMAVSGDRLYVVNSSQGQVEVIDITTDTVGDPIPVGSSPWGLLLDGDRLYIANRGSGTVTAIDISQGIDV